MTLRLFRSVVFVLPLLAGTAWGGHAQTAKHAHDSSASSSAESIYRGGMVSPPLPKPKFKLTDSSGMPFDFSSRTQGYITLLFFGYTHCPDVCPLQMDLIAQALKKLPIGVADRFKIVFVTTDPARDTPQTLRAWLDHFDKRFIGLTGSQSDIDAAQIAANLSPAKKSAVRSDGAYEVGHAAFLLAYTRDNLAHLIYPAGVQADDLAHDMPYLAKENWGDR